jgi:hypothetical protein
MTEYFEEIEDIRITGKIKHDLKETIVVVICAVAGGCDSWEVIEDFARVKLDWYREVMHLRLENGIPSHKRQKCEYDHDFLAQVLSFAANFHA